MTENRMNLQPGPTILHSYKAANLTWIDVVCELIDNGFDAGASRCELEWRRGNYFCIRDDGNGCNDIEKMLTLGKHFRQPTTRLGRYGIGLKSAACWLWGELVIDTCCNGQRLYKTTTWFGRIGTPPSTTISMSPRTARFTS